MLILRSANEEGPSPALSHNVLTVTDIVRAFTEQLLATIEHATVQRSQEMLAVVLTQIPGAASVGLGEAGYSEGSKESPADREQRQRLAMLAQNFEKAMEASVHARMRELLAGHLSSSQPVGKKTHTTALSGTVSGVAPRARRQVRRRAPILPPPPDPEQLKRDAEVARLRALLRPASEDVPPPAPAPVFVVKPEPAPRPATPGDILRALEKEIQDAVPTLAALGPERCGAQIAAWTGTVRELRDRLPPDVSATMRPAFRIFLEHLTHLRDAMEAHVVDALEPSWNTPDWGAYVEVNRACAEGRAPELPAESLVLHHRTMLRALLKPHRRSVPQQAISIITAAAEVLPPGDAQLRSATSRHATAWKKPAEPTIDVVQVADKAEIVPEIHNTMPARVEEVIVPIVPVTQTAENEFDLPWTQ